MQENLHRIASAPLYFPPGSAWRYSVATDVLGAIIAVVQGGPLADAVATYVTEPLGMRDSAFVVREQERLAVPYADGNPRAVRMGEPHQIEESSSRSSRLRPGLVSVRGLRDGRYGR